MAEVVVIGSYVQDLAFRTEIFPLPGETRIGKFFAGPGGKGFNQAVACHRQGVTVKFIGAVGADVFAQGLRDFVESEGITASLLEIDRLSTGAASIVVNGQGQNQIIVDLGANNFLTPEFVEKEFRSSNILPKVVLVQVESNLDSTLRALELGKESGSINILNPAPINEGITKQILSLADIITPNETEFLHLQSHLFGRVLRDDFWLSSDTDLQQACRTLGVPNVILTLGDKGCFVSLEDAACRLPAIKALVKDTTGAGDAFSGGLAAGIVKFNRDIRRAVQFATVVAGISTERQGTAPAMPNLDEVTARFSVEFNNLCNWSLQYD